MFSDRLIAGLELVIDRLTGKYKYAFTYEYEVTAQQSDNSLNLKPTDANPKMDSLPSVPIRYNTPAEKVTVPKGTICYVKFAGGRPDKPFVDGFKHGDYTRFDIGDSGFKMARQGDLTSAGGIGTMLLLTPLPGNIAPAVLPGIPYLVSFGYITNPPVPAPIQGKLIGTILTGSPKNFSK